MITVSPSLSTTHSEWEVRRVSIKNSTYELRLAAGYLVKPISMGADIIGACYSIYLKE